MKIARLIISNFRSIKHAELHFDGHTLLVGQNNVGKSTICEALDLVLGPDRASRFPPVEEFDFHNANYLAPPAKDGEPPTPIQSPHMRTLAIILFAIATASALAADPVTDLARENPQLANIVARYANLHEQLTTYAKRQGFRQPYEMWATLAHEIIHIDSSAHQGYYIDGVYYEPYVGTEHWPSLRNRDIAPLMRPEERGVIYSLYMTATPTNNLGNILDEVNAYTHVLGFICKHEPQSVPRQVTNLVGHLNVVEAYLRVTRTNAPSEYKTLLHNRFSAGAIVTLEQRAWTALAACGWSQEKIPSKEAVYFINTVDKINKPL